MKIFSGLAAVALATSSLVATASAGAHPHRPGRRPAVSAGAAWLKGQLTHGILHNEEYDYDDLGLSADVAFALNAVGGQDAAVTQIVNAIEPVAESWVGGYSPGRVYAGSLAKMVSVVKAADQDPETYGGADQVARLEGLVSASAPLTGRLEDAGVDPNDPFDADFVNVIGQSFAARALTAAGSGRAADATSFLLRQQCNDGFFRGSLTEDKTAPDQGCDPRVDAPSIDTTALAVINILDTPQAAAPAKGAAYLAAGWLKTQQAADGSFSAGGAGHQRKHHRSGRLGAGRSGPGRGRDGGGGWLRGIQVADLAPCVTTLSADNGAIAYKPGDLAARTVGAF